MTEFYDLELEFNGAYTPGHWKVLNPLKRFANNGLTKSSIYRSKICLKIFPLLSVLVPYRPKRKLFGDRQSW